MDIFGILVTEDKLEKTQQMIIDNGGMALKTNELNVLDRLANGMFWQQKVYSVVFIANEEQFQKILKKGDIICNQGD